MSKVANLSFDDGLREVNVNGKPIRFNPNDVNIITRINTMAKNIDKKKEEFEKYDIKLQNNGSVNFTETIMEDASTIVEDFNKYINEQIDYIFDAPVTGIVFGNQSPISMVKGEPLYHRFLECIVPYIRAEVEANSKARVDKYVNQVK